MTSSNIQPENRLIIVGNGFDLANQLPTRYTDFMVHLLFYTFMKAYNNVNGFYEDEYFIIFKLQKNPLFIPAVNIPLNEYLNFRNNKYYIIDNTNIEQQKIKIQTDRKLVIDVYFHVKDHFINQLFDSTNEFNWVDIETEYYKKLIDLTFKKDKILSFIDKYTVKKLHNTFQMIQTEFEAYLKTIKIKPYNEEVASIFDYPLNFDFNHRNRPQNDKAQRPKETLILNFNYTYTIANYNIFGHWHNEFQIINIHGTIDNPLNPIIFGYGDETIPSFKQLEELNDNELLRFMKNKDYALTTNYSKLISFIEQAPFEVYILGHSCGLSDRVMLNTIFEKEECKSIFIFYHKHSNGTDNFMDVYHNISRQFSLHKRADLRKKVKAKSISMQFPQQ